MIATQPIINGVPFLLYRPSNRKFHGDIKPQDYWKYQWCCGATLATYLMTLDGTGRRYLELGPGLGLCSVVAAYKGFDVTIVDAEHQSIDYTQYNLKQNHFHAATSYSSTWKDFSKTDVDTFDVIAGGDICYNQCATEDVLTIIQSKLAATGAGYFTDQLTENHLITALKRSTLSFTQTNKFSPVQPELLNGYDKQENCLFTIIAP